MNIRLVGIFIFLVFLNILGCSLKNKSGNGDLKLNDCYQDRKNTDTIRIQDGMIDLIASQYVIISKNNESHFIVCNLPKSYQKIDAKINCKIVIKEIYPNERWMATPSYIMEISDTKPE